MIYRAFGGSKNYQTIAEKKHQTINPPLQKITRASIHRCKNHQTIKPSLQKTAAHQTITVISSEARNLLCFITE